MSGPLENLMLHPVCPSHVHFSNWFRSRGHFIQIKKGFACERREAWRTTSDSLQPTVQRKASRGHQFSEGTQLNSKSLSQLDIRESFLTKRATTPSHQAGICVISFHVWCFQMSWTWYRLWGKLRSTHLVATTVNEMGAVMWHRDTPITLILTLAVSPRRLFNLCWASYLFGCCFSMRLRKRKLFCSLHFFTGAKNLSI